MAVLQLDKAFSSGNPTYLNFQNGRHCTTCGCLTEHRKEKGYLVCEGCETKKPYLKKLIPGYKEAALRKLDACQHFYAAIARSILDAELEVVTPICRVQRIQPKLNFASHWTRFHKIMFDGNRRLSELENLYQMENSADKNTRLTNQNILSNLPDMEGN